MGPSEPKGLTPAATRANAFCAVVAIEVIDDPICGSREHQTGRNLNRDSGLPIDRGAVIATAAVGHTHQGNDAAAGGDSGVAIFVGDAVDEGVHVGLGLGHAAEGDGGRTARHTDRIVANPSQRAISAVGPGQCRCRRWSGIRSYRPHC